MRVIKLMADYECFPLWEGSPGKFGNIDPKDLPISQELQQNLTLWAEIFDETLNMEEPVRSGFAGERSGDEFRKTGEELARQLQEELGNKFLVKKEL